jgi:hypothetical protein
MGGDKLCNLSVTIEVIKCGLNANKTVGYK